jgi:hypothetical protein
MKTTASHPVNFFNISAVEVPKSDSPGSPPKEAPSPRLLLSWTRMIKHSTALINMKKKIER